MNSYFKYRGLKRSLMQHFVKLASVTHKLWFGRFCEASFGPNPGPFFGSANEQGAACSSGAIALAGACKTGPRAVKLVEARVSFKVKQSTHRGIVCQFEFRAQSRSTCE